MLGAGLVHLANGTKSAASQAPYYLYGYTFAINKGKTVKSLTLPNNSKLRLAAVDLF